jgi:hypothetical protein
MGTSGNSDAVSLKKFQLRPRFDLVPVSVYIRPQGHRIKIGSLGRMANPIFGANLSFCSIYSQLFTSFFCRFSRRT